MSTTPTDRDIELLRMPAIAAQMPVVFENGMQWSELRGTCAGCSREIPAEHLRGAIARHNAHMAAVEAVGICFECKLLTRFVYRLHDDHRITGPRQGRWVEWRPKPSVLEQLIGWLRALFRR